MGTPTRVVLLRNMVGPGQVDEDLEDEVANECSKYGQVQSVMIFEVTTPGYPDDQAVRIFVEFERMEQATKVWLAATRPVAMLLPFGICCMAGCRLCLHGKLTNGYCAFAESIGITVLVFPCHK